MRPRIRLGRSLIKAGKFIHSLGIMVMKPKDLIEFSRMSYAEKSQVGSFCDDKTVARGLTLREKDQLAAIPCRAGNLLLLGSGGGREAIAFAREGFAVTAIDYVPAMIEATVSRARGLGLKINGEIQEISCLEAPANAYDVAWLSAGMYSSIPTRKRRVEMLRRIVTALKPEGYFATQLLWQDAVPGRARAGFMRRVFALITLGNLQYEPGDRIWNDREFMHLFSEEKNVRNEFASAGLEISRLDIFPVEGEAVILAKKMTFPGKSRDRQVDRHES